MKTKTKSSERHEAAYVQPGYWSCAAVVLVIAAVSGCSVTGIETAQLSLRTSAPKAHCVNVPVHTTIELPEQFTQVPLEEISVILKEQGKTGAGVPGQIVPDRNGKAQLWWVLPQTKAGSTGNWVATLKHRAKARKGVFSWKDTPADYLDLVFDGRKVIRYMYARDTSTPERAFETSKPFHHIFDAQGEKLLTNGDPNALYPHHRGLFIGWSRMEFGGKEYDFWGMSGGKTAQVHQKFLEETAGPVLARSSSLVHWNSENDGTVISEQRQITVFRQPDPTIVLLEFNIRLKAVNGDVVLVANKGEDAHKAPEHGGFHFRPHNDAARGSRRSATYTDKLAEKDKVTYLFHEDGIDPQRDTDLVWVAMSYGLNGRYYSVQHINHPDNPSPTVYSAYRDYGRFGAYFKRKINTSQTLTLRYYIWVVESKMPTRKELAGRYSALINVPSVEVFGAEQKQ